MSKPTILIVPGFWEGPGVFDAVRDVLVEAGHDTHYAQLVSTGTVSPGNPTMKDDIAGIRQTMEKLVQKGDDVVLVLHSAAGFLGAEAMEGLDKPTRQKSGEHGGIVKIVFVTAGIAEKGHKHENLPFADYRDGALYCKNPRVLLFSDIPDADVDKYMGMMKTQPAEGWGSTTTYSGWEAVPSVYIVCAGDELLPAAVQQHFATVAGSKTVETLNAGHMPQLSKPKELATLIGKHAASI